MELSELELFKWIHNIEDIIIDIRQQLAKEYDVSDNAEHYTRYAGLCYVVSEEFARRFNDKYRATSPIYVAALTRHGEIKHSPFIADSKYWPYQHTWVEVLIDDQIIYVDGTCGQFKDIFSDIPDYYISANRPKWFLDDRNNPVWGNKFIKKINLKLQIRRRYDGRIVHDGIIEMLQYDVWGRISDIIRMVVRPS